MKKFWNGAFALLILTFASLQANAQQADSNLTGIWANENPDPLAFLTIIHKGDGSLAIIGTSYINLVLVEGFQSSASLGQADTSALGENIGTAVSFPAVFYGADVTFALHRPAADELLFEMTSCEVPDESAVSCDLIQEQSGFALNVRVRHIRAF